MAKNLRLSAGEVEVRLITMRDCRALARVLSENRAWLAPWEATLPSGPQALNLRRSVRAMLAQARLGAFLPLVIEYRGQLVGQLNVASIQYGAMSSATLGYWIAAEVAGKSITPTAVALVSDYLFDSLGLHRVQIDIRPENAASLRVVEKLGFRREGLKVGYMHIAGKWCDHLSFALTTDELTGFGPNERVLARFLGQ